jgi:hypothetical protein
MAKIVVNIKVKERGKLNKNVGTSAVRFSPFAYAHLLQIRLRTRYNLQIVIKIFEVTFLFD